MAPASRPIEVPTGPVWEGSSGYREIWKLSPDGEKVRRTLLALLRQIEENPQSEPHRIMSWSDLDDVVIWQLGEFRENRAVDDLRRIVGFSSSGTRRGTVQLAKKALEKIEGTLSLEWTQEPEGPHRSPLSWIELYCRLNSIHLDNCGCDPCKSLRQVLGVPEPAVYGVPEPAVYAKRSWWKKLFGGR